MSRVSLALGTAAPIRLEARLAEQRGEPCRFADEAAPERSAGFVGDEERRQTLERRGDVK